MQREDVAQISLCCGMSETHLFAYKETTIASHAFQQVCLTHWEQAVFLLILMDTWNAYRSNVKTKINASEKKKYTLPTLKNK